jgi:hypothetical protein
MTNQVFFKRPECVDILKEIDSWFLKQEKLNLDESIENIFEESIDYEFYQKFWSQKEN